MGKIRIPSTISLTPAIKAALLIQSERTGETVSAIVRAAVWEYLKREGIETPIDDARKRVG